MGYALSGVTSLAEVMHLAGAVDEGELNVPKAAVATAEATKQPKKILFRANHCRLPIWSLATMVRCISPSVDAALNRRCIVSPIRGKNPPLP